MYIRVPFKITTAVCLLTLYCQRLQRQGNKLHNATVTAPIFAHNGSRCTPSAVAAAHAMVRRRACVSDPSCKHFVTPWPLLEAYRPKELTLCCVGEPALKGNILLQSATVPHLDCLVTAGAGKEHAVASNSQLVHALPVLSQMGYEHPLGAPRALGRSTPPHGGRP